MFGGLTRNGMQRRTGAFWVGRLWLMMAALLLVTSGAEARTADISLTVIGDERRYPRADRDQEWLDGAGEVLDLATTLVLSVGRKRSALRRAA